MAKENRRVQRTKTQIQHTLINLMQKNELDDITVTQLCDQVPINRSTFYAHYNSTYDVLLEVEDHVMHAFVEYLFQQKQLSMAEYQSQMDQLYLKILTFVQHNKEEMKVMFTYPINDKFHTDLLNLSQENNTYTGNVYQQIYTIAGGLAMVQLWLKNDLDISPKELSQLMIEMGPFDK